MNIYYNPSFEIISFLFLLSVFIFYVTYKKFYSAHGVYLIMIFRGLVLLLLLLILFDFNIEKKGIKTKNLPWRIYVDKSLSIKYHKQPSSNAYKKGIQKLLAQLSEKGLSVEAYSFGSKLDTLTNILDLKLDANSTNFGLVADHIKKDYKNKIAGAIILTDGQINQGPILENIGDLISVPIHIVGIGEITPMRDVFVQSVDLPPKSVKGDKINIDVLISSLGVVKERINITLFNDVNKLIGSKIIKMSGTESVENIRFQIVPDKIGENNYLVKCSALPDEINIQNNQQKLAIHVMKDQYNIALVTGSPSFNTKVIKSHLLKNGNNFLDHYIIDEKNFSSKIKKFLEKKYEVIIFDNNPVLSSSDKWSSILRVFAKKLISHNSSFFIIPGPETDFKSLSKYLKIVNIDVKQLPLNGKVKMDWQFLDSWRNFSSLAKDSDFLQKVHSYPPQIQAYNISDIVEGKKTNVYANYIKDEEQSPLLIIGEKKLVRFAFWNSIDISSLKYMLSGSDFSFVFESTIKKITNWLMKKSDDGEFIFRTDKNSYQQGEEVTLTGVSSESNNKLIIADGLVELYQENNFIGSKNLFFDLNKNKYKSKFWAPKPGEIYYKVIINRGFENFEVSNGTFMVKASDIEMNKIVLNYTKLINLATLTDGKFKKWSNISEISDSINQVEESESYISYFLLRTNYLFMFLIFVILSLEWLYRKKIGLI